MSSLRNVELVKNIQHNCNYILKVESYIYEQIRGQYIRRIFEKIQYTSEEIEQLNLLNEVLQMTDSSLISDLKQSDRLRLLYCANFNLEKIHKILKVYCQWRQKKLTYSGMLLQSGLIYIGGFDRQWRPIIILNTDHLNLQKYSQEQVTSTIMFYLLTVENQLLVPYYVENWILILEVCVTNQITFQFIKNLLLIVQINFCQRLDKLLIVNAPTHFMELWERCKMCMNQLTIEKCKILGKTSELLKEIDKYQLETKFGGLKPNIKQFWPPTNEVDSVKKTNYQQQNSNKDEEGSKDKIMKQSSSLFTIIVRNEQQEMIHSQSHVLLELSSSENSSPKSIPISTPKNVLEMHTDITLSGPCCNQCNTCDCLIY